MRLNVAQEQAALERMTVGELQKRFAELCGERSRSRHRRYLVRRILWRLQAAAEGGLSERALRRAAELADVADARVTPPRARPFLPGATSTPTSRPCSGAPARASTKDRRLPPVGGAIVRQYKGRTISVVVLTDGFECDGERYRSLSAAAKAITGQHINGFRFFGLEAKA